MVIFLWIRVLLVIPFTQTPPEAATVCGTVVRVVDGDTIRLLTTKGETKQVRLAEIDAPERSQRYGAESQQFLSTLILEKEVCIEKLGSDRYQRLVGEVFLDDLSVNAELVGQGMAWVYKAYCESPDLIDLEEAARHANRGLWSAPYAIAPWRYRYLRKTMRINCDNPKRCKEMDSCLEARIIYETCGTRSLDYDRDGLPCEALCRDVAPN